MGFLDRLLKTLGGAAPAAGSGTSYWFAVRCDRCGEILPGRIDMRNELSVRDDSGGFMTRKTLIGSNRCFNPVETVHYFDTNRRLVSREITGGSFVEDA